MATDESKCKTLLIFCSIFHFSHIAILFTKKEKKKKEETYNRTM